MAGRNFPCDFNEQTEMSYDSTARRVVVEERRFQTLLQSKDQGEPNLDQAASLLAAEVMAGRLNLKKWDASVDNWIARVNFVANYCPETEIVPIDEEARQLLIEQICHGALSYKEIKDRPVLKAIKNWISPEQVYYITLTRPQRWSRCEDIVPLRFVTRPMAERLSPRSFRTFTMCQGYAEGR